MTKMPDDLNLRMLRTKQAARSFYRRKYLYGKVDFNEVLAEAYLAMAEAMLTWNPEKESKMESWIVFMVHRTLRKKFFGKMDQQLIDFDVEICLSDQPNQLDIVIEREKRNLLSDTAKEALHLANYVEVEKESKNYLKKAIKKELSKRGISSYKIRYAFSELKEAANGC